MPLGRTIKNTRYSLALHEISMEFSLRHGKKEETGKKRKNY
jgi:hypothetical protein